MTTTIETGTSAPVTRLGVVSFLNTLPLIEGLDRLRGVELVHTVPSQLIDRLLADELDVALCSSVDYQRSPEPLVIVPGGLLGCEGPTLTVRLYSTEPIERIERVCCDTDSHTSIALMLIVLRDLYGITPEVIDYDAREHVAGSTPVEWPDAVLLIGDKVVTDSPPAVRYPHQLDLGEAWTELTGLPFVFAMWVARASTDPARMHVASAVLDRQRRANRMRLDTIVHHRAPDRRWPKDLAATYVKERLHYDWTPGHVAGLERFFTRCAELGLTPHARPLDWMPPHG
jgi:chorismate dehydratase